MSITEVRRRRFPVVGVLLLGAAGIFAYLGVLGIVELERGHDAFVSVSECQFDVEDCQESAGRAWPGAAKASPFWFFAALPTWFVGMVATFGAGPPRGRRRGHVGSWGSDSSWGSSGGSSSSCGSSSGSSD